MFLEGFFIQHFLRVIGVTPGHPIRETHERKVWDPTRHRGGSPGVSCRCGTTDEEELSGGGRCRAGVREPVGLTGSASPDRAHLRMTLRSVGLWPVFYDQPVPDAKVTPMVRPPASSEAVSAQMRRMPREGSRVELRLRHELHALGLRYRVNLTGLPGTPDVAFTRARIAVFVDGCFWHRCPDHGVLPKANRIWWVEKLDGNVERDRRKDRELEMMGWLPVHVWEHDCPVEAALGIRNLWWARSGRADSREVHVS